MKPRWYERLLTALLALVAFAAFALMLVSVWSENVEAFLRGMLFDYAYDWTLPYAAGERRARSLGNEAAAALAVQVGAEICFDEAAQTPYFSYTDRTGAVHEVWFEDVRSIQAKFDLIKEYGLRGAGYWQIMRLFRANWALASSTFRIEKFL